MSRVSALAGRPAMGEIIRREEVGLGRVGENIVAGVDARMKVGVDESRRNQAAFGIDLFIDRLRILFADKFDAVAVVNHDTVFDDFMFIAVEADNPAALDKCFHCPCLSEIRVRISGRTNKRRILRQAESKMPTCHFDRSQKSGGMNRER